MSMQTGIYDEVHTTSTISSMDSLIGSRSPRWQRTLCLIGMGDVSCPFPDTLDAIEPNGPPYRRGYRPAMMVCIGSAEVCPVLVNKFVKRWKHGNTRTNKTTVKEQRPLESNMLESQAEVVTATMYLNSHLASFALHPLPLPLPLPGIQPIHSTHLGVIHNTASTITHGCFNIVIVDAAGRSSQSREGQDPSTQRFDTKS